MVERYGLAGVSDVCVCGSLTAPVAPSTDWTWAYEFDLDGNGESPASAPYWWMAKAVDTSGNVSVACNQQLHSDGEYG